MLHRLPLGRCCSLPPPLAVHCAPRNLQCSLRPLRFITHSGGTAAVEAKGASTYLVYWRKPEEWGQVIHDWASDNGQTGTIMTFYEITDGDLSYSTEFNGLPNSLLRRALETLVKKGKAQLIRSADGEGDGVRFL